MSSSNATFALALALALSASLLGCPEHDKEHPGDQPIQTVPKADTPTTPTANPSATTALGVQAPPPAVIRDSGIGTGAVQGRTTEEEGPARVVGTEQPKGVVPQARDAGH